MSTALLIAAALQANALQYLGPSVEEPAFQESFNAAVATCGLDARAVSRELSWVRLEPKTSGEIASLEQQVRDFAAKSGVQGPENEHRASYAFIRGLLETRTLLRYTLTGTSQQAECVETWLKDQGFEPLPAGEPLPPELSH